MPSTAAPPRASRASPSSHRRRQSQRHHRRDLRRHRRAVRRRLATPPPLHLMEGGAGGSGGAAGRTVPVHDDGGGPDVHGAPSPARRTRLRLAVASIPLVLAAVLFAVNAGDGTGSSPEDPVGQSPSPRPAGPMAVDSVPAPPTPLPETPEAPPGHRTVAVRFAAPDAVDLAEVEDRVDVVGIDGGVVAGNVQVLQDRSTDQATVLVLAVPEDHAPELAAAAVAQDLTLLVVPVVP